MPKPANKLTDRRLRNKRFRDTETKIILALSNVKELFSAERLIKIAGISRSTLYRHHGDIYNIAPDYERYILQKHYRIFHRLLRIKGIRLRSLYERTLTFIFMHHEIIYFLSLHGNQNLIEKMLYHLEPKIISAGKLSHPEIRRIYIKEVAAIIEQWQQDGFAKKSVPFIVDKIMYLTDTAPSRLNPIAKHMLQ